MTSGIKEEGRFACIEHFNENTKKATKSNMLDENGISRRALQGAYCNLLNELDAASYQNYLRLTKDHEETYKLKTSGDKQHNRVLLWRSCTSWHQNEAFSELYRTVHWKRLSN